jgi:hypothetical protein
MSLEHVDSGSMHGVEHHNDLFSREKIFLQACAGKQEEKRKKEYI